MEESGLLQGSRMHRLAIMTVQDLRALERAVENGQAADRVLIAWRTGRHSLALSQFMSADLGLRLSWPAWERQIADEVMGVVADQTPQNET